MKLSKIKLNPTNPRIIKDEKFKKLVKSIQEFPEMMEKRPMVCVTDADGLLYPLGGNMRLKALQELKYKEIPDNWVMLADEWTEEKRNRFTISDNVSFGEWDYDELANNWNGEDLIEWGVEVPEWEAESPEAVEDDYEIPATIETDIVLGDLFEIGEHRLLCGDSTDSDSVAKLMNGEKADMGFNDPPYGMKKENEGVLNDNLNYNDLLQFNKEWIALQFSHIKDNGSWYCWGTDEPLMDIYSEIIKPYIKEQKATFRNLITWDKGSGQGQNSEGFRMYPIADEKCLFVMLGQQMYGRDLETWYDPFQKFIDIFKGEMEKARATIKDICEICNSSASHYISRSQYFFPTGEHWDKLKDKYKGVAFTQDYEEIKQDYEEIKQEWYATRAYFDNTHDNQNNVWRFDRTSHKERETTGGHATPKPIKLCERAIKSSCPEIGLVIDYFGGSGSTMVACEQLKRNCYMMELEPKNCQIIVDRMKKLDPDLVIKKNGKIMESKKHLNKYK